MINLAYYVQPLIEVFHAESYVSFAVLMLEQEH